MDFLWGNDEKQCHEESACHQNDEDDVDGNWYLELRSVEVDAETDQRCKGALIE